MTKAFIPPPTAEELQNACKDILMEKGLQFHPQSLKDIREVLRIGLHARFFIKTKVRVDTVNKFIQENAP
jgi:hypothetical protein